MLSRLKAYRNRPLALTIILAVALFGANAAAETIGGVPGSSPRWGSGWRDLAPPIDFKKGERLKLLIGGNAGKVIVRLLPASASPDTSEGVVPSKGSDVFLFVVPPSREVVVVLPEDRKAVKQISVHGGPNPWNEFPLGGGNGPATIEAVERQAP